MTRKDLSKDYKRQVAVEMPFSRADRIESRINMLGFRCFTREINIIRIIHELERGYFNTRQRLNVL